MTLYHNADGNILDIIRRIWSPCPTASFNNYGPAHMLTFDNIAILCFVKVGIFRTGYDSERINNVIRIIQVNPRRYADTVDISSVLNLSGQCRSTLRFAGIDYTTTGVCKNAILIGYNRCDGKFSIDIFGRIEPALNLGHTSTDAEDILTGTSYVFRTGLSTETKMGYISIIFPVRNGNTILIPHLIPYRSSYDEVASSHRYSTGRQGGNDFISEGNILIRRRRVYIRVNGRFDIVLVVREQDDMII